MLTAALIALAPVMPPNGSTFRPQLDEEGHVRACTVVDPGEGEWDSTECPAVLLQLPHKPAVDEEGRPVSSVKQVTWTQAEGERRPFVPVEAVENDAGVPKSMSVSFDRLADGTMTNCTMIGDNRPDPCAGLDAKSPFGFEALMPREAARVTFSMSFTPWTSQLAEAEVPGRIATLTIIGVKNSPNQCARLVANGDSDLPELWREFDRCQPIDGSPDSITELGWTPDLRAVFSISAVPLNAGKQ